jgi:hypothetical protein
MLLDRSTWDLCLDAEGHIAVAGPPYSLAQQAACAIKLFLGELYYCTTKGRPYFQQILGKTLPSQQIVKSQLETAALTVPGVVTAQVFVTGFTNRALTGQVQITDSTGAPSQVGF